MTALAYVMLAAGLSVGCVVGYLLGRYLRAGQVATVATADAQAVAVAEVRTHDQIAAELAANVAKVGSMSREQVAAALEVDDAAPK